MIALSSMSIAAPNCCQMAVRQIVFIISRCGTVERQGILERIHERRGLLERRGRTSCVQSMRRKPFVVP